MNDQCLLRVHALRYFRPWALLLALTLATLSGLLPAPGRAQQTPPAGLTTYQITLTNLTNGQPFASIIAVTHDQTVRLVNVGALASDALAALAQAGDATPMVTLLNGLAGVSAVSEATAPLAAGESATFTINAAPGDFFSLAAMLACTNDGFVGLDSANLPDPGEERTIALGAYDVGREENSEASADLPDECSELGPVALTGDPNDNLDEGAVATNPPTNIVAHPGITGGGDLTPVAHGWTEVATITITPLAGASPTGQAGTITSTRNVTATGAVTATNALTATAILTATDAITATEAATIAVTTMGVPSPSMTEELPTDILDLMEPVPGEEPTEEMQAVLDALAALAAPPIAENSARNARMFPTPGDAVIAVLAEQGESTAPEPVGSVTHRIIPGPSEDGTLLRIITPEGDGPFPVVVYYHGGGWVIAGLDAYEASARALANAADAVVVMVAYRQSPEVQFPAAVEDAYAAFQWTVENAAEINGDPERVAVAGESAGGNLATVVAMLARDQGETLPVYQVLIYPVTQLVSTNTPSYETYAEAAPLSRAMMPWFAIRYLADPVDASDPYVSPLLAEDLSGLPPATILTAEIDPLQSEGAAYAARLEEAGVAVVYQNFAGVTHEFFGMGALLPEAQEAVALAAEGLQSAFGSEETKALGETDAITGTGTLTETGGITTTEGVTGTETLTETGSSGGAAGAATDPGAASPVQVSLIEWAIEMPTELPAGSTTFAIRNDGARVHNFEIEGQGITAVLPQDLQPGVSDTLTVDLAPGEYIVYCPVGNHAGQGMELTLTVTE